MFFNKQKLDNQGIANFVFIKEVLFFQSDYFHGDNDFQI